MSGDTLPTVPGASCCPLPSLPPHCPPQHLPGAALFGLHFLTAGAFQLTHCAASWILFLVACVSPATWFSPCQPAVCCHPAKRHVLPQDRVWFRCEKTGLPCRVSPRGPPSGDNMAHPLLGHLFLCCVPGHSDLHVLPLELALRPFTAMPCENLDSNCTPTLVLIAEVQRLCPTA